MSSLPFSLPHVVPLLVAAASLAVVPVAHSQTPPDASTLPALAIHCAGDQGNPVRFGTGFHISASVDNANQHPLTFTYTASTGKITGSGANVAFEWGTQWQQKVDITCRVTDDTGRNAEQTFSVYSYSDGAGGGGGGTGTGHRGKRPIASEPAGDGAAPPPPPDQPAPIAAFPWPPPQASSRVLLASWPRGPQMRDFGDIDARLTAALQPKGYVERSYYSVPGGFALVTRLEQIYSDGRSMPPPARFSAQLLPPSRFSDYIRALFSADPGYYRVIVFVATDLPFSEGAQGASQGQADAWIRDGVDMLPATIASRPLTDRVRCAALIYQFRQSNATAADKAELIPGIDAVLSLTNAGLWQALN